MNETKSALIIAVYRYEHPDLDQLVAPAQDAESLARVLGDTAIGGFQVRTLINEPSQKVKLEIESFCDDRKRDDLLLLYFSGHGIKDIDGQLYFATVDTKLVQHNLRRSTAVEARFVNETMSRSRSRRQILLLDCCYSGAFREGMLAKGDKRVGAGEQLQGKGRVVLTASDAFQYSFEGERVQGEGVRSVFTGVLVHGLETGEADLNGDGFFSLDEVYDYVFDRVSDQQPEQKPTKVGYVEGTIIIGNNPHPLAAQLSKKVAIATPSQKELVPAWTPQELDLHCQRVSDKLTSGEVVVFLGPEANLCGRPRGEVWKPGNLGYVPSYSDLAAYLAESASYPAGEPQDLMRVSQYVSDRMGTADLYRRLHSVLVADHVPTPLHNFLARVLIVLREKGPLPTSVSGSGLLILTTNYDDVLESTFAQKGEEFHLLTYDSAESGKFIHRPPRGDRRVVSDHLNYPVDFDDAIPVIVKIAGGVDRNSPDLDSFVISEDDYTDYLARPTLEKILPVALLARMARTHMLFLGCGPSDWNRPASVDRIFPASRRRRYRSWAVQADPFELDQSFWLNRDVEFVPFRLEQYVQELSEHVRTPPVDANMSGRSEPKDA